MYSECWSLNDKLCARVLSVSIRIYASVLLPYSKALFPGRPAGEGIRRVYLAYN